MKTIGRPGGRTSRVRTVMAGALVTAVLVLTGCGLVGGSSGGEQPVAPPRSDDPIVGTTTPVPPTSAVLSPEEALVADSLRAYNAALAVSDFNRACALMVPEAQQSLVDRVRERAGGAPIPACPDALITVFAQEGAQQAAVDTSASTVVEDVAITATDATVVWSSTRNEVLTQVENTMRLVNGQWLVVGTV